jgi:hypothetical protein
MKNNEHSDQEDFGSLKTEQMKSYKDWYTIDVNKWLTEEVKLPQYCSKVCPPIAFMAL